MRRNIPEKINEKNKATHPTTSGDLALKDLSLIDLTKQDRNLLLLSLIGIPNL